MSDVYIWLDLVGGFKHKLYVPFHIWDVILPIHELILFKMVIAPPTKDLTIAIEHYNRNSGFSQL